MDEALDRERIMKWYHYSQNNSGGVFVVDENVAQDVFVQAESAEAANRKAKSVGLYFNGNGDCQCCGHRWCEADGSDAADIPSRYGEGVPIISPDHWRQFPRDESRLHYADGRVVAVMNVDEARRLFP